MNILPIDADKRRRFGFILGLAIVLSFLSSPIETTDPWQKVQPLGV